MDSRFRGNDGGVGVGGNDGLTPVAPLSILAYLHGILKSRKRIMAALKYVRI